MPLGDDGHRARLLEDGLIEYRASSYDESESAGDSQILADAAAVPMPAQ